MDIEKKYACPICGFELVAWDDYCPLPLHRTAGCRVIVIVDGKVVKNDIARTNGVLKWAIQSGSSCSRN